MKKAFLFFTALAGFVIVSAQQKAGTVIYERKINLHRNMPEQVKAMLPEFRISQHILLFSDSISTYKTIPDDEAPDPFAGGGGGRTMVRMGGETTEIFKNFSQSKGVQSTELGGKSLLIVDTIKQQPWKLTGETKQVLGYTCHKATRKMDQQQPVRRTIMMGPGGAAPSDTAQNKPATKEVDVVAWYTEDFIAPAGPDNYGLLPGVILEIDVDNGGTTFIAKQVKKTVDLKELKEPKKGKVVTRAEYQKMMSEMSPMGAPGGGATFRFGG